MPKLITFALAGLLAAGASASAAEFVVAPNGRDDNPGTRTHPFATLERARDAVRALKEKQGLPRGGVTVWLRGGVYSRTQSFALTAADSGAAGAPITYRAFPGETARLNGGRIIPAAAFKPVTDPGIRARLPEAGRDHVLQADLKALGMTQFTPLQPYGTGLPSLPPAPELFVNGQAMTPARWPNEGFAKLGKVIDRGSIEGSIVPGEPPLHEKPARGAILSFTDSRLSRWTQAKDIWLFGYWWWDWAASATQVASIDVENQLIKTAQPHTYGFRTGGRYYVFNLLEELDVPGEWYLDRENGILYLYPPAAPATMRVELSQLDQPMVTLNEASHITLQGLTLETTRSMAVTIKGGSNDLIAGCTIRKTGQKAVSVEGGTAHGVVSCDVYDTNGGITMSGGDRRTLTPGRHYVENNEIRNYSRIDKIYNPAIQLNGVGNRAVHNRIHNAPHMGIGFGGNDHLIAMNEIFDVCKETSDAGVIYTGRNWTMRGNIIRNNYIHDIQGIGGVGAYGVYLDDCFSSAEVTGNVFYAMANGAVLMGGGRDNILRNNILIDTGTVHIDNRGLNWGKAGTKPGGELYEGLKAVPYQQDPWRTRFPKLVNILDDDPGAPKGNTVEGNVLYRVPAMQLAKEVREFGAIRNNWETNADPGFVNAAALDFRLRKDAPVFKQIPGFQAIPFDQIGLELDAYRKRLPLHAPAIVPAPRAIIESLAVTLAMRPQNAVIRYTLDGSEPTAKSPLYTRPILLKHSATVKAAAFSRDGGDRSEVAAASYTAYHLGAGAGVPLSALPILESFCYNEVKRDVSFSGDAPIRLGGKTFTSGLGLHPQVTAQNAKDGHAFALFALDGPLAKAMRFKATVGIDDDTEGRGSATFAVEVRRDGVWQKVFQSGVLRGGQQPQEIDADIHGADQLRLVVTDGGDNIHADHAAWGNARLE